jgi:hypothetical protein
VPTGADGTFYERSRVVFIVGKLLIQGIFYRLFGLPS